MGDNPSDPKHLGFTIPVDTVSWDLAMAFCRLLTQQESAAGRLPAGYEYTLPTEAQWEYACRAGGAPAVSGNEDDLAWYNANSGGTSHRSGLKQPNAWGFFDLHGNIMQWCRDWYATRYTRGSITDPAGPATGTRHVARGGNYASPATDLRDARRFPHPLNYQNNGLGLRLALAPVVK
jgi:formylglycine-generating enzyme required for sulfatase activity